jgi:hypothetical protein
LAHIMLDTLPGVLRNFLPLHLFLSLGLRSSG